MPELQARSAIVAMETSPLSEAQSARLLVAECHRISSEFGSALCECVILNKINEAEGRVLAVAEGLTPDSTSDFMKVPYARSDYLNGRSCEVTRKMSELLRELARCEPLVQLSVLGTMTELERREITSRLEAQDFKDGTVFMKQGWHGDAPVLTRTGYACRHMGLLRAVRTGGAGQRAVRTEGAGQLAPGPHAWYVRTAYCQAMPSTSSRKGR